MITITCLSANILFIVLAYYLRFTGTTMVILALSAVSIAGVGIVYYKRPKAKIIPVNGPSPKPTIIKSHKILQMTPETVDQN
jgi:hypothetical protein